MGRIVGLLVLALAPLLTAACRIGPQPPRAAVYAAGAAFTDAAAALTLLDPTTLADRADAPPVAMGVLGRPPIWVLSGDGSTLVAFDGQRTLDPVRTTAVVIDLPGGTERARLALDEPVGPAHLSRDGRRLVVAQTVQRGPGRVQPRATWRVLDTADGRVLARVEVEGPALVDIPELAIDGLPCDGTSHTVPNVDPWSALRWANGRIALPDRERLGPDWGWWCAPLSAWDGTVKKSG